MKIGIYQIIGFNKIKINVFKFVYVTNIQIKLKFFDKLWIFKSVITRHKFTNTLETIVIT